MKLEKDTATQIDAEVTEVLKTLGGPEATQPMATSWGELMGRLSKALPMEAYKNVLLEEYSQSSKDA